MTTFLRMDAAREAQLIAAIATISTHSEALAFREALSAGAEQMTADLMRALRDRIDLLAKREGRK